MSQHDFNIANQTFPSFRSDLNDALVAAATMSAGASAPTTPYAYQLWFDTTTGTWKVRNSGNTAWISTITTDLATGNVGIGGSPSALLHLEGSDGIPQLKFLRTGTTIGGIIRQTSAPYGLTYDAIDGNTAAPTHVFRTSTDGSTFSESMRIDSSGNLLVGNTWIGSFSVSSGTLINQNGRVLVTHSNDSPIAASRLGSDGAIASWYRSTALVGSISVTGSSTSYNETSDYRLKENVTYDWDATTRLKQLKPARFNFISAPNETRDGFLAHEVEQVSPQSVTGTKDAMMDEEYEVSAATGDIYTPATDDADEVIHSTDVERPEELEEGQQWRETTAAVMGTRSVPDYQGIDQSKLVPLLVKTIQELEARITALEA